MESFVRSKYESRRWALDGPPPTDPSVLDNGSTAPAQPTQPQQHQQAPPVPSASRLAHAPSSSISTRSPITTRQPQAHQLLSSNYTNTQRQPSVATQGTAPAPVAKAPTPPPSQPKAPENDLFSLDFHAPPVSSSPGNSTAQPKKDVKQDILSLFSSPPAAAAATPALGQFGGAQASPWGSVQPQQQHVQMQQPTSMIGNSGAGAWGASSGWTGTPAAIMPPAQGNLWGNPTPGHQQQQANLFNTNDVWGSASSSAAPAPDLFSTPFSTAPSQKKDDAFGDIWGGFK